MPVISKEEIWFMGTKFYRVVRMLKDKKFRIKYPDIINDVMGVREAVHETYNGAAEEFSEMLAKFEKSQTQSRKVILYEIKDSVSFSTGAAVSIAAGVYTETCYSVPDTEEMRYDYKKIDDREQQLPYSISSSNLKPRFGDKADDGNCIAWTAKRHQFFVRISDAMKRLKSELGRLKNSQSELLELADSSMFIQLDQ
jgi:hypothetical protein